MNRFLERRYVERVHRLALGIEPLDAMRGDDARVARPLTIAIEVPLDARTLRRLADSRGDVSDVLPRVPRHASNRYALTYSPGTTDEIVIRIFDRRRYFVPRRFRIPIAVLDEDNPDGIDNLPIGPRVRRPALFPGAAYDTSESVTAIRGRVTRSGVPVRWARVEAVFENNATPVAIAHGDDRGEFLLIVPPHPLPAAMLPSPVRIRVQVFARNPDPVVPPTVQAADALWGLEIEDVPAPPANDTASPGRIRPPLYTRASPSVLIPLTLGQVLSGLPDFVIP